MADLRRLEDERSKQHWAFVEATANRVDNWPSWKQAAVTTPPQTRQLEDNDKSPIGGDASSAMAAD